MSITGIIVTIIVLFFVIAIVGVFGLYLWKVWEKLKLNNKIISKEKSKQVNNKESNYCQYCGNKLKK